MIPDLTQSVTDVSDPAQIHLIFQAKVPKSGEICEGEKEKKWKSSFNLIVGLLQISW